MKEKRNGIISLWKFLFAIVIAFFHSNQFYDNPGMEHLLDMQIPSMSDNKLKKAVAQRKLFIINNLDKINKG